MEVAIDTSAGDVHAMTTLIAAICCSLLFLGGGLCGQDQALIGLTCAAIGSITLAVLFGQAQR